MQPSKPLPLIPTDKNLPEGAKTTFDLQAAVQDQFVLIKLYRELAIVHDSLVKSVQDYIDQQAK